MTAVGSFSVGEILTAASMNEIGAWTSYTPTIGGVTTSGVTGKYYLMNKIGFLLVGFTFTAAPTAAVTISRPTGFNPVNTYLERGNGLLVDTSATNNYTAFMRYAGTNFRITFNQTVGAAAPFYIIQTDLTNTTTPVTIANGDTFQAIWIGEVS